MVNLCWKLALKMKGQAAPGPLDTYGEDRLPVMRGVVLRTDSLTTTSRNRNPVVRTLFNDLGPCIVRADVVQENATAGMSRIALDYRDGPLSSALDAPRSDGTSWSGAHADKPVRNAKRSHPQAGVGDQHPSGYRDPDATRAPLRKVSRGQQRPFWNRRCRADDRDRRTAFPPAPQYSTEWKTLQRRRPSHPVAPAGSA